MATWFGHTQTITSISKSVTTVAGGIIGLESNLATFMKKVIYYEKFFYRMRHNLPPGVVSTAARLFARCYEYRDEIRRELESNLAYVVDAGRWVIGMEDWNAKMEKRLNQMNELVLLANTLLNEYAVTGKIGAQGSMDELHAFLSTISSTIVLRDEHQASYFQKYPQSVPVPSSSALAQENADAARTAAIVQKVVEEKLNGNVPSQCPRHQHPNGETDEDDESLNPFADTYQQQPPSSKIISSELTTTDDKELNLSGFECLDMEAIPRYTTFRSAKKPTSKPSIQESDASSSNGDRKDTEKIDSDDDGKEEANPFRDRRKQET